MFKYIYWGTAIGLLISKLIGVSTLSWFWSTFMLWLPYALMFSILLLLLVGVLAVVFFVLFFALVIILIEKWKERKNK